MHNTLTWLHISDIHFYPKMAWRDNDTREDLIDYLNKIFNENKLLRPDFIFCTGDIAFGELSSSPLSSQYAEAINFFDKLRHVCGKNGNLLPKEKLFVVPGNHDVNRNKINQLAQITLQNYARDSVKYCEKINNYIAEYSFEFKNSIFRLEDYANFVKDYLPHQNDEDGRLCFGKIIDLDGLSIGIAGFNSAWSCAGPEDDRHIWLPAHWQFNYARKKIRKAKIRIGLIHHPLDWFNESDQKFATERLSKDFHFLLHGHKHNSWVTPVNTHIIIAAGAMGAALDTEFGFNIVQLNLLDSKGMVYLYTYSISEGGWKPLTISAHAEKGQWEIPSLPFKFDNPLSSILSIQKNFDNLEYIDSITNSTIVTKEQFINNIDNYSDNLQEDVRQFLIEDIVSNAWDLIVFDPFLGNKIFTKFEKYKSDNIIVRIILPLCKIANALPLSRQDVEDMFSIFKLDMLKANKSFELKCIILFLQLIKYIIYNKEHEECIEGINEKLIELKEMNEEFVNKFCADIYFRNKCDFVDMPVFFRNKIKVFYDNYVAHNETAPLARLSPIIFSPLQAISKGIDYILSQIDSIAGQCSDATECRWCLIAWMRVVPLFEDYDDNNEFNNNLRLLINRFDNKIVSKSSFFQYSYLISLLHSFLETKDIKFLFKYEDEFARRKASIRPPQIILLQLEYASCLYIFCEDNDIDTIASLKIVHLMQDNQKIIDNYLFNNILLSTCLSLQKPFPVNQETLKKEVFKWIISYTKALSNLFAKPLIEKNHTNFRYISAAIKVYQNRSLYIDAMMKSLEFFYKNLSQCSPSFCAKSCFCFKYIGKQYELIKAYIEKALLADEYSIIRNARDIARCLYLLRNYSHNIDLNHLSQLEKKFCEITKIGTSTPKFFWIYYATRQLSNMPKEYNFIYELGNYLEHINRKAYQLKLKYGEVFSLTLSDDVIKFIRDNKEKSIIAAVLNIDLTYAEAWNHLGTAVFDNGKINRIQSFKIASIFYTVAKCFSREKREYDMKYCYNYIRCKSNYYLESAEKVEAFFIHDTLYYLMQPKTKIFLYRSECVVDFFRLLNRDWNYFDDNMRQKIKEIIDKVSWLKKLNLLNFQNPLDSDKSLDVSF